MATSLPEPYLTRSIPLPLVVLLHWCPKTKQQEVSLVWTRLPSWIHWEKEPGNCENKKYNVLKAIINLWKKKKKKRKKYNLKGILCGVPYRVYMEKSLLGKENNSPTRVNFGERLHEKKVDPSAQTNSAKSCSDCPPWPSRPGWASQSGYKEKNSPG